MSKQDYFLTNCLIKKSFKPGELYHSLKFEPIKTQISLKNTSKFQEFNKTSPFFFSFSRFTKEKEKKDEKDISTQIPSPYNHFPSISENQVFKITKSPQENELNDSEYNSKNNENTKVFENHLEKLREYNKETKFFGNLPKKPKQKLKKIVNKYKILQILDSFKNKSKSNIIVSSPLEKQISLNKEYWKKNASQIIDKLKNLLTLFLQMYRKPGIAFSFLKGMKGFKNLERYLVAPGSKEFHLPYTLAKLQTLELADQETVKNAFIFEDELHQFLKRKNIEFAEYKADSLVREYSDLKKKTYNYLDELKVKNTKKFAQEKEFLIDTLQYLRKRQSEKQFNLTSLRSLDKSEKLVGRFDQIKDPTRIVAKSLDLICKNSGF